MEQTEEQKEGEKILEKDLSRNYALGITKEPKEKFSSFWGAESWPK
jgi:hypothetical protein